jgi:hypothetical protein
MNAIHKTTTKKSMSRANTVVCTCTCGWQESLSLDDWRFTTMRQVWREVGYLRQDHKEESK